MTTGETITELTGTEGGVWRVHIRGSIHVLDLDVRTVERRGSSAPRLDRP